MITTTLIIFMMASGDARAIYGSANDCELYRQMSQSHSLFVDDLDLPRQEPKEVFCQCVNVEMEPFE